MEASGGRIWALLNTDVLSLLQKEVFFIMQYQVMNMAIDYDKIGVNNQGYQPMLKLYLPDASPELYLGKKRPMVLICPGGAYVMTTIREADPIAFKFLSAGFAAAVLHYSVGYDRFPAAQLEVAKSVATIRENAEEWGIDPNKIIVCGFSAGGHLAGSFGTLWNRDFITDYFGYHKEEHKPNGMILGYPVLTSGEKAHRESFDSLLGERKDDPELLELLSVEKQVSADTPRAFIWHTYDDNCVPVESSLLMATAMTAAGINVELHIYSSGSHGLSLANHVSSSEEHKEWFINPDCQGWIDMAIRWVENL